MPFTDTAREAQWERISSSYETAKKHLENLKYNREILGFITAYGHPSHMHLIAEDVKEVQQRAGILTVAITRCEAMWPEVFGDRSELVDGGIDE